MTDLDLRKVRRGAAGLTGIETTLEIFGRPNVNEIELGPGLNDSPLCAAWIRATFARVVSLPKLPPDPAHRATGTTAAVIPPALWLKPRCSRSLSFALQPPVENVQNTVSLPLAVSFPAKCVYFFVSRLGFTPVQSSRDEIP